MSSGPLTCPRCYKNLYAPEVVGSGLVRCDACGHVFPPGNTVVPQGAAPYQPPRYGGSPSYAGTPVSPASFAPTKPAASFNPNYGPATPQPQTPSGPSVLGCIGIVVGIGVVFLSCCGLVGFLFYMGAQAQPAAPPNVVPFNPPQAAPQHAPMEFPEFHPLPPGIPGYAPPATSSRSLDDILADIKRASPSDFNSVHIVGELRSVPVDEARRGEVVQVVLAYLERATPLAHGQAQPVLERWASKGEANQLAKFAAGNSDSSLRRTVVGIIAQTGGDAETANTIAPLLNELSLVHSVQSAMEKIGPEAEDALLSQLDNVNLHGRHMTYRTLGRIGTDKAATRLRQIADGRDPLNSHLARRALSEIEGRAGRR